MTKIVRSIALAVASIPLSLPSWAVETSPVGAPLIAQKPIIVPGGPGGYDFMRVDGRQRRLLAAHKGTGTLAVLNLDTEADPQSIKTGASQGIAVDARDGKYFAGNETEATVVAIDRKTLARVGEIKTSGPVDAVAVDTRNGRVYADEDNGTHVWVIDGATNKLVTTITIAGAPEDLAYDGRTDRLYQNIKVNDTVAVINPATDTVEATWSTAPAKSPHGLAIDGTAHRLFAAGSNGKLAVLDMKTGKLVTSVDIAPRVDQIAFDPGNKRVYCACAGFVSVVQETDGGAKLLGNVAVPKGAHTIAVDRRTHAVWISYADAQNSYLMKLTPGGRRRTVALRRIASSLRSSQ